MMHKINKNNNSSSMSCFFLQPVIPITHNLDPIKLLTDDATIAVWNNEGLPSDRMSTENAIILTNSDRWPLIIDPQVCDQRLCRRKMITVYRNKWCFVIRFGSFIHTYLLQLQGIKWIKAKYGEQLVVVRLDQKNCIDTLELAITRGSTVLIENLPENLDPVLDPLIGKNLIKRGR